MKYCSVCGAELVEKRRIPVYGSMTGELAYYRVLRRCPNATIWNVLFGRHYFGEWGIENVKRKEVK